MRIGRLLAAGALALAAGAASAQTQPMRLFIAGDSTAAYYGPDRYPQLGWGMMLKCAFNLDDVQVLNYARAGRSTKSFTTLGHWAEMERQIRRGDTVLIQFGHNDQRTDDLARYTDPDGEYRTNLIRYIDAVKAKGAQAILLTPITRRTFVNGKVVDTHGPYGRAMLAVARETRTPVVDVNADTMAWLQGVGEADSKNYFLYAPIGPLRTAAVEDDQHPNELGARAIADVIAGGIANLNLPVSAKVKPVRAALTRPLPTGGADCE